MQYAFRNAIRDEGLRRLADLRHEIKDSFVNLEVFLLRPVCQMCETVVWSVEDDRALSPKLTQVCSSRGAISCVYDPTGHHVTIAVDDKDPYQLVCGRCGRALDIRHKSEIPAEQAPSPSNAETKFDPSFHSLTTEGSWYRCSSGS